MIIDQLFTRPIFEEAPMASPEQLAYNRLRAQYDSYQNMTGGGGNTAVSRDPAHAAKLATIPAELARMASALKAKGIDAEAQYDALSGPAAAPVDANQAYGGVSEVAPPGAKAERMVRHIKQGYAKDGKLTPKEKGIAFATAWKAHNAGRVEEATGDERFDSMMGQIQREPRIPDSQMPPTDVKDLYHWAVKHHKPYHKIFAKWANREGFKSVAPALQKAGNLDSDALDYWTPDVWKLWYGPDSEMPRHWSKERVPEELRDYLETVFDAYDRIVFDWPTEYRQISEQGVTEATDPKRDKLERMIWKYYGQIYDYGDDDGLDYLDRNGELWNQLMDKYNGEIDDIVASEPTEVLMQAAQELKGIAGDMKYELDEQGVAEAEKNPHTSALGRALYRDLSKEKKASPQQVQRNKERWAQRQAEREQGVAEGQLDELSRDTLNAYLRKSKNRADDFHAQGEKASMEPGRKAMAKGDKYFDKRDNVLSARRGARDRLKGVFHPKEAPYGAKKSDDSDAMQDMAEGHKESYVIVRTDSEGKKDVFAGNFDTYEQAQKELDACLAHPLHTKHKQKFEIKRKGHKDVSEADKHSFIGRIQRHNELKNKVDRTWRDAVDAENKGDKSGATRAFNKHVRYTNLERPGTWRTVKDQDQDITEMDKSEPSAGRDTGPRSGPEKIAKPITKEKMVKHASDILSKSMAKKDDKKKDVKESDTLMLKLRRALIREGRVKELADDLKTMNDADFMKKYGKAKAAIRRDMKRVDEATPAMPAAPAAPAAPTAPQSNRQYSKTYNAQTKTWTTNAPATPATPAQPAAPAPADADDAEENFDSWEQEGNMAVPVKNGVKQTLYKMPLSQVPKGAKITQTYTTYQQQGNMAVPVDANGALNVLGKIPLNQVPQGSKIVQNTEQGALAQNLPGAAPAAPAATPATPAPAPAKPATPAPATPAPATPAAPAAAKPATPAAPAIPKPAATAPAAKPGETPMAKAAAAAPVSERKGTRRLREADPASPTYHNMGLKQQPMPAPGSTVAWDAPLHVNPSVSMGAPLPSGDPIENVKAGVQDAKEFYDLARKAGMPIGDAIPLAYKAGVATATGDIGGMVQAVTAHSNKNLDKGIQQLKSAIKDYADIYAQMLPTSEYYKKNIAPNPQLKAQADEFIKTNMTPQQFAQSINQAETALKAPSTMPTQASPTVPSAQAALGQPAAQPVNELSTNKLAQYKTAAARDAKKADQAGDFKRGDKRLSGMVQATKKQFDNDAKKVDESRAARRALMARIVNSR
jgi:hypothetical protein